MPTTERPRSGSPLGQGDILNGISLFATKDTWAETGGEAARASYKSCLVVSRPCALAHKRHVLVAGVEKYPDAVPKGVESFAEVVHFLTRARDGSRSPDVFYLGQLPDATGRFCARLDALFLIEAPSLREKFLAERRVATLHPDFARDLHGRLFNAFASLGFDDHSWLSTEDLEWLVNQGRADVAAAEQAVHRQEALKSSRLAEGKQFADAELRSSEKALQSLQEALAPYEAELARRAR
jgi:hypothetical protein